MEWKILLAGMCLGLACFIAGIVTDALMQADFIKQKDYQIQALKDENKAIMNAIYKKPEVINHDAYKPNVVEVIDLPRADRTYHCPW